MQASGLVDDDTTIETPQIIEIPLKQLGANVDLEQARHSHALHGAEGPAASTSHDLSHHVTTHHEDDDDDEDGEEDKSDQCLLGESKKRFDFAGDHRVCQSHSDLLSKLRALDTGSTTSSNDSPRHRSLSADAATQPLLPRPPPVSSSPPPPPPPRGPSSVSPSSSSSASSSCKGALASKPQGAVSKYYSPSRSRPPQFASPTRVRFSDSLPNGSLVSARSSETRRGDLESDLYRDLDLDRAASDNLANDRLEGREGSLYKALSDDSRNFASSMSSKAMTLKENNMVRSLLHKTRSYQDHLYCADVSLQGPVCLETMTKEELLFLWKTSELDLNRKLDEALKEKARLEKKLALLQNQSPV
nr:hypothetical protein BaRGS_023364 [Batillaria attramentaria]